MPKPKPIAVTERCRRIIAEIGGIANDKVNIDKETRKLAKETDPRHIEAWMRLDRSVADIESLDPETHHKEVVGAIVAIPLLGPDHYEQLADAMCVPEILP